MLRKEIIVNVQSGLESKMAAMFIQKASNFKSSIYVENGERKANAKSLLGVLSLGISENSKITITAEGSDEENAITELENYLSGKIK